MPPDQPSRQPSEALEAPPPDALQKDVDALRKVYGLPKDLPESMDQAAMNKELNEMRQDATYNDLAELIRYNQLVYRKNALQRQGELEQPDKEVDEDEFAAVNQGETFFEYYQSILSKTISATDDYLVLRRQVSVVPQDVLADERETEVFLQELKAAAERRLNFSNAALTSYLLTVQRNRTGEVMQDQATLLAQLEGLKATLDVPGKAALMAGDAKAIRIHCNTLDQRIIELIAEKGHLPSKMLLALQAQRFADILTQQKSVIRDRGLARERAEWEALSGRNKLARAGKGKPLTAEEGLRFQQLKELLERAMPGWERLSEERKGFSNAMIKTADSLSEYHERSLELLVMQHQFQSADSTEGATSPNPDETPPLVREKIDEVTQMRADFHRERIASFVNRFDEEVLTIGFPEQVEDFSNKAGREFVRNISNALSYIYTLPAPDSFGIRDFLRGRLAGPLNDAMGWPADKMDLKFEELEPEERQAVMEKAQSVADAVRQFDRTKIEKVNESLGVIQGLPKAREALGKPVKKPLPEISGRITAENINALIAEHGLPTAYALALKQLNEDMGDPESGFLGEVQQFTDSINTTLDVHLDTADSLFRQSEEWRRWMYALLAVALGGAAVGYLGPKLLKATVRTARGTARTPRQSAPRASPSAPEPAPPSAPRGAEAAIEAASTADDLIKNEARLAEMIAARGGKAMEAAEALQFLRSAEEAGVITLDRSAMALLRDSPGAQKVIAGAVRSGRTAEVGRALRAANNAARLRIALNAAAAAGDIFVIYMAYADWQANGERIAATDNEALKDLYKDADYVYAAEGASGVVGLSLGGYAIVSSYIAGEGILAAVAAPGALIMVPVAVAAVAGGYYYRKLEGVREDWTKEERDWLKHSQGDLLRRLEERGPGEHTYWQGAASGTNAEVGWNLLTMSSKEYSDWREKGFERVESANAGQRFQMTRAYMGNVSNMPPLDGESEKQYQQRYATYLQDTMGYIAKQSDGEFSRQYPWQYENAELHAELRDLSSRLTRAHVSKVITIEKLDADSKPLRIEFDLAQYTELCRKYTGTAGLNDPEPGGMGVSPSEVLEAFRRSKISSTLAEITAMSTVQFKGQKEKQHAINGILQYELLDRLRHEIAGADMRIEMTDFNGLGITGAEEEAKNLARFWVGNRVKTMLREESDRLMERIQSGETLSIEDIDEVLTKCSSFLQLDALQYQTDGEKGLRNSLQEARASTPDVLTYPKLKESLYLWPGSIEAMRRLSIGRIGPKEQ